MNLLIIRSTFLFKFFNSSLALGKTADSILAENIYDLILELNRICPSVLLSVVPQLEFKLKVISLIVICYCLRSL